MEARTARPCCEPARAWLLALGLASCGLIDPPGGVCSDPPGFTGAATCPGTGRGGFVRAEDSDLGTDFSAAFWAAKLREECQPQTIGPCKVKSCTPLASGATQGQLEAGHLLFASPLVTFEIPLNSEPSYSLMAMPGLLFRPGAGLTIEATGGTFPAFSTTFCEEGRARFTSPSVALPSPATIDRSQDLVVTWEGPGVGVAEIEIDDQTQADLAITCDFPLDAGTGTIPKEVLALVNPGQHTLKATQRVRTAIVVGDACVDVDVAIGGLGPGRTLYDGEVAFQ